MKIVFPFSGVAAVFLPVGKVENGGTCEFASKKCLMKCAAFHNVDKSAKKGEFGYVLGYKKKEDSLNFITKNSSLLIADTISKNMADIGTEILYWFASGDCSNENIDKIIHTMEHLSLTGISQCGFTRNRKFWIRANNIDFARIALTVEDEKTIKEPRDTGFFAIPNYSTGRVKLVWGGSESSSGSCGGMRYILNNVKYEASCQLCFDNKRGCFCYPAYL